MQYWWVNQGQTYKREISGGYMWSPKRTVKNAFNQFYENMRTVEPGDIIYSVYGGSINAIGIARKSAITKEKSSEYGVVWENWNKEGWYVEVDFTLLNRPIRPADHMRFIEPHLPDKYSPLLANGRVKEAYLCHVPNAMALELNRLLDGQVELIEAPYYEIDPHGEEDDIEERRIAEQQDINAEEKLQLILARSGQGTFRNRVIFNEQTCKITGVKNLSHLIASHIKPWRISTKSEKTNGDNGLLLSPHIDNLFDRGFISFSASGFIISSPKLSSDVVKLWSIDLTKDYGKLRSEQEVFMQYHREHVFQK